ncbi:triacylglycerol lipase [Xylella taiwanensis]|uniref:Triacylglycerol lipase n=1 Tax=Xylella taiwanensis TaxID=1444770 RepID=A0ABS8TTA2_9GAMM|nr:triacylglycerol lipase [Xylella taiwanensis]MCD8456011.1 triacylglycerol lipase [Xylella taiwanensis]MCD8458415.1 triacylglycerol lipase [Xylella taiwanensis]MCD8460552.1 triacylglycerol lipase [Xylella taiwanensis]MCD8463387.1 triacylglycerol lipase [Xylella taiwanensis]MCD8465056.1 triacylglycerol lipase [Xylella taiwanensis]
MATKYPIILEPGFGATDKLFVLIDYWYRIPEDLRKHGANVYLSTSSALQRPDGRNSRGEQLLTYVKAVLAVTGAEKVNLIGYSQGGLSARYVAAVAPDLVASVTTIGTPHHGSELADYYEEQLQQNPAGRLLSPVLAGLTNVFAFMATDNPNQDMLAALKSLTTSEVAVFNKNYPSAGLGKLGSCQGGAEFETLGNQRQYLYSWGAAMKEKRSILGTKVIDTGVLPFVDAANFIDLTTKALHRSGTVMIYRNSGTNDGMVSICSSMFGKVISSYFNWNHLDQINQILGIRGVYTENPLAVIRTHVNCLKMHCL